MSVNIKINVNTVFFILLTQHHHQSFLFADIKPNVNFLKIGSVRLVEVINGEYI